MENQLKIPKMIDKIHQLNQEYIYQLLFLISTGLYHSSDFYIKAYSPNQQLTFFYGIFDRINLQIIQIILTLITIITILTILFKSFILKKQTYSFQILQRILLPFNIFILERISIGDSNQKNSTSTSIFFNVISVFCTIIVIILILLKNFKLNLLYKQNRQKSLIKLQKTQFFIILLKLLTNIIFTIFFKKQILGYLFVVSFFNVLVNIIFLKKIVYEHPNIEFLNLCSQFYIWVPNTIVLLEYFNVNRGSMCVVNVGLFIVYICIGSYKPQVLVNQLQDKYKSCITRLSSVKLSEIKVQNQPDLIKTDLRAILSQQQTNSSRIPWSNSFKSLIYDFLAFNIKPNPYNNTQTLHQNFDIPKQIPNQNSKQQTKIISLNKLNSINSLKKQKYKKLQETLQSFDLNLLEKSLNVKDCCIEQQNQFRQKQHQTQQAYTCQNLPKSSSQQNLTIQIQNILWLLVSKMIHFQYKTSKQLRYWICYNFTDINNFTKQRLFYCYYLNSNENKDYFDQMESQMCYQYLVEKIGRQRNYKNQTGEGDYFNVKRDRGWKKFEKMSFLGRQTSKTLNKTVNLNQQLSHKYCFYQKGQSYFNSKFNQVFEQSVLFEQILNQFQSFIQNQQKFIQYFTQKCQKKNLIIKYIKKRNLLRHNIEDMVEKYHLLYNNQNKFYVCLFLNYIKDYWLNNDHGIAYDNFRRELEKLTEIKGNLFKKNFNHTKISAGQSKNVTCVVSGITQPDSIFISCLQFKKLLEIEFQQKYQSKNISRTKSENYHLLQLNSFLLPLWHQDHQNILNSKNCLKQPINHIQKKYFLLSKKQTFAYEIKFNMYFHMMYQFDLLMVLDISYKRLQKLIVKDQKQQNTLFSYRNSQVQSNKSLIQKSVINHKGRRLRQSVMPDLSFFKAMKKNNKPSIYNDMLAFDNDFDEEQTQQKFQLIQLFNKKYYIHSIQQNSTSNAIVDKFLNTQIKSMIEFQDVNIQQEKKKYQYENKLNQLKFYKYKKGFRIFHSKLLILIFFYLVAIVGIFSGLLKYLNDENYHLRRTLKEVENRIQWEEQYFKVDMYTSIEIGMLSNILTNQIDLQKISTSQRQLLLKTLLQSIKYTIQSMKKRHQWDLSTIEQQNIKTKYYWDYNWVKGYNRSFEMNSYWIEMVYFILIEGVVDINQINLNRYSFMTSRNRDILVTFRPLNAQKKLSTLDLYESRKYLTTKIQQTQYIRNQQHGVQVMYSKGQSQLHCQIKQQRFAQIVSFQLIIITFFLLELYILGLILTQLTSKYEMINNSSNGFRSIFYKSTNQLKIFMKKLCRFQKSQLFEIIKPKKVNFKQITQMKTYTVKSIKSKQFNQMVKDQTSNAKTIIKPSTKPTKNVCKTTRSYKSFYFRFLKYPLFRSLTLIFIALTLYNKKTTQFQNLQIYSEGLQELTLVNLGLVKLMTTNLFITNYQLVKQEIDTNSTTQSIQYNFDQQLSEVSGANKIKIIQQLFINDLQQDDMIQKVLYGNVCKQFESEFQCSQAMKDNLDGMYQSYGRCIKNVKILQTHLIKANKTIYGTLDTLTFQSRYLQSYQNLNQLVKLSKKIINFSFKRILQAFQIDQSNIGKGSTTNLPKKQVAICILLFLYIFLQLSIMLWVIRQQTNVIQEQLLRISDWETISKEKHQFDGFEKYANQAKEKQWAVVNQ